MRTAIGSWEALGPEQAQDFAVLQAETGDAEAFDAAGAVPAIDGSRRLRLLALVVLVAVAGGLVLIRPSASTGEADATSGSLTLLAGDLTALLGDAPEVRSVSSAYVPGSGVVATMTVAGVAPLLVDVWLAPLVAAGDSALARLPDREALVLTVFLADDPASSRVIRILPSQVPHPSLWSHASLSSAMSGQPATADASSSRATAQVDAGQQTTATAGSAVPLGADFAAADDRWVVLAGTWEVSGGSYRQTDDGGYDHIAQLTAADAAGRTAGRVEVRMRALDGSPLNAGLVVGLAVPGTRDGATMIDLAADGGYVRWGRYAANGGGYEFVGGATLAQAAVAGEWHTLSVVVADGVAAVSFDGATVGEISGVATGAIGLVTSVAKVEFDDLAIVTS
ncbi:MAG: hypothetical protein WCC60_22725 [Ilumatobacteraceae bacterium]